MADIRIESQGFSIGRWRLPPFALRRGECVTLRFPLAPESSGHYLGAATLDDRVISGLTGRESIPGLNLHASVVFAQWASSHSGWRRWLQDLTPFSWLKRRTPLSEAAIRSFLLEHKIDGRLSLRRYAGTPRNLLGLKAAFSAGPGAVVFATAGLDPLGVRASFQVVAEHLPDCSAIYLGWPFLRQGTEHHHCFPGSLEVTVIDQDQPTFAH